MTIFSRTDTSPLSRWWWTVDRLTLFAVLALIAVGLVLILSASPAIANKHNVGAMHYFYRQLMFVGPALALMISLSLVPIERLRAWAPLILGGCFLLLLGTLVFGTDVNGARRWLSIGSFKLQPSEFIKPFFVIALAMILSDEKRPPWKRYGLAGALLAAMIVPLTLQPDYGQTALVIMIWGAMLFLSGLPMIVTLGLGAIGAVGVFIVYQRVEHVAERIDGFFHPNSTDTFQIKQAVKAFQTGGPLGQGMGEGKVKWSLPDAHTDFIFAVGGEELGLIFCLVIVALFAFVVFRGLVRAMKEPDHFVQLAIAGLAMLLALQAFINLGVNVNILPAKGMTLPFVSYGGSSLLAVSVTLGLLLSLTRRRITGGLPKHVPLKRRVQ